MNLQPILFCLDCLNSYTSCDSTDVIIICIFFQVRLPRISKTCNSSYFSVVSSTVMGIFTTHYTAPSGNSNPFLTENKEKNRLYESFFFLFSKKYLNCKSQSTLILKKMGSKIWILHQNKACQILGNFGRLIVTYPPYENNLDCFKLIEKRSVNSTACALKLLSLILLDN